MGDVVRVEVDGPIGRLTLARPEKLNALSRAVLEHVAAAARWFDSQREVKVVIVAGEGRAFSAGFDLADPAWPEPGPPESSAAAGRAMAEAVGGTRSITIASIRGHCIGGGVVLASACDLRVASTTAEFRIPEIDLGLPLFWTGVPRLVRELGPAVTKELVLTGRAFGAEEARAMGFVNRVVPDERLEHETEALAAELAAKPTVVLEQTKRQVEEAAPPVPDADGGLAADVAGYAAALADPEARAVARGYASRLQADPDRDT